MKISDDALLSIELAMWQLDHIPEAIELDSEAHARETLPQFEVMKYTMAMDTEIGLIIAQSYAPRDDA